MKEAKGAFYNDDIPETVIAKSYVIQFGNMTDFLRTEYTEFNLACVVSLFAFGNRKEKINFDEGYSRALCFLEQATDLQNIGLIDVVINVTSDSIEVSQVVENENLFRYDINLTIRTAYLK